MPQGPVPLGESQGHSPHTRMTATAHRRYTTWLSSKPLPQRSKEKAASGLAVTPSLGGQRRHLFPGTIQEGLTGHYVEETVSSCRVRVPRRPGENGLRCTEAQKCGLRTAHCWGGEEGGKGVLKGQTRSHIQCWLFSQPAQPGPASFILGHPWDGLGGATQTGPPAVTEASSQAMRNPRTDVPENPGTSPTSAYLPKQPRPAFLLKKERCDEWRDCSATTWCSHIACQDLQNCTLK